MTSHAALRSGLSPTMASRIMSTMPLILLATLARSAAVYVQKSPHPGMAWIPVAAAEKASPIWPWAFFAVSTMDRAYFAIGFTSVRFGRLPNAEPIILTLSTRVKMSILVSRMISGATVLTFFTTPTNVCARRMMAPHGLVASLVTCCTNALNIACACCTSANALSFNSPAMLPATPRAVSRKL